VPRLRIDLYKEWITSNDESGGHPWAAHFPVIVWTTGQVMRVSPKKAVKTESAGDKYAIPLLNRKYNGTGAASSTN